jgi:transposase
LSDRRKYRKYTAEQKVELVLASFRGDRSVAEICREHDISETLLRRWRDQLVEAGAEHFQDGQERSVAAEQRRGSPSSSARWAETPMSRRSRRVAVSAATPRAPHPAKTVSRTVSRNQQFRAVLSSTHTALQSQIDPRHYGFPKPIIRRS